MSISRKVGLGAATVALLATSISPALAGGGYNDGWNNWGGNRGYGRHHRRHGDDDAGNIIGGVLIGAILVGVLASASKKKQQQRRADGSDYPPQDGRDRNRGDIASEDAAVDACASAAESRAGRTASVRDVDQVRSNSDGWDVEGILETRDTWRDRSPDRRRFTCSVRYGAVDSVYVEDPKVAFAD